MHTTLRTLVLISLLAIVGCQDSPDSRSRAKPVDEKSLVKKVEFLEFYADWCGPCKDQKPIVEALKKEFRWVEFQLIDVDRNEELSRKYRVEGIPHMVVLVDGKVVDEFIGLRSRGELVAALNRATELALEPKAK